MYVHNINLVFAWTDDIHRSFIAAASQKSDNYCINSTTWMLLSHFTHTQNLRTLLTDNPSLIADLSHVSKLLCAEKLNQVYHFLRTALHIHASTSLRKAVNHSCFPSTKSTWNERIKPKRGKCRPERNREKHEAIYFPKLLEASKA